MIDKLILYEKIMLSVSESVKNILDETFTTYPWDKVSNYIFKVQQDLSISIKADNSQEKTPAAFLNQTVFDDDKYIVYSLIKNNITNDEDYFDNIKKSLQLVGLNYSKSYIDDNKEFLVFLPKKQNSLNMEVFKNCNYLYHVCPKYVTEKIKKIGFTPKSKNKIFDYDPRIHFFFPNTPLEEIKFIRYQLDKTNDSKGNTHEYDLIKIKIPNNILFFKDLDCNFGIFTNDNISPDYIEDISSIEGMNLEQYINWQMNQIYFT